MQDDDSLETQASGDSAIRSADEAPKRRNWAVIVTLSLLAIVAVGWSGAWFALAGSVETEADRWLAREAADGRAYRCGERNVAGFPFRMEIECRDFVAEMTSGGETLTLSAKSVRAVAQIYKPNHVIADVIGPVEIKSPALASPLTATFTAALASRQGSVELMDRIDIAVEGLLVRSADGALGDWKAKGAELHLRRTPVPQDFDLALSTDALESPGGPAPVKTSMKTLAKGVPQTWRDVDDFLRIWTRTGARLEAFALRAEAARLLVVAKGDLSLNEAGRLNGNLVTDVAGAEGLAAWVGGESSGLVGLMVRAGASFLGQKVKLEERAAIRLQTTVRDGDVKLGPVAIGKIPPLFR